jgi:hypothetical protein
LTRVTTATNPNPATTSAPVATRLPLPSLEVVVAVIAFVGLCAAVLTRATQLLEPDDYAYRASIVALTQGHIALTQAQYTVLAEKLGGIMQWVQLGDGRWISEKNPGYPFLAAPFQMLGILRVAPLFYGALGCLGLYAGGRRWLGRWGGTWAVLLFCASGAALVFAWRATMPTFTHTSLVAAGTGGLVWATMLATDVSSRRRTLVGLLAFLALEAAVAVRYTNVLVLLVAVLAVVGGRRAARLPLRSLAWWLGSVGLLAALLATFDLRYYGGAIKTGYASGEITFSLSALGPNLRQMPYHLVRSMPLLILAAASTVWIAARVAWNLHSSVDPLRRRATRRDAVVAAALVACWAAIFGLYLTYTWTVGQAERHGITVHVVRFYLPALGAVALLGAWLLARIPRPATLVTVAVIAGVAVATYPSIATGGGGPGGPGGPVGGPPFGSPGSGRLPPGPSPSGGGQPSSGFSGDGQMPAP